MPVRRHPIAVTSLDGAIAALPIDDALIGRLKATYALVREKDLRLAELFYAKLFAAAPQLRALFRSDLSEQSRKLIASLDAVVRGLESPAENAAMLAELGQRHAGYGAKPEHYALVTDLLIQSMSELLGVDAGSRALSEWRMALTLMSNQMIAAASSADTIPAPNRERGKPQ